MDSNQAKKVFLTQRAQIFAATRDFFNKNNYIEIHTPSLVKNPGLEIHLRYFTTYQEDLQSKNKEKFYLPTSPEYHLKKVLADYPFDKIYEISKAYRNQEKSRWHEPEFFMLEWYQKNASYKEIAKTSELLLNTLKEKINNSKESAIKHLTVQNAFLQYSGINLERVMQKLDPPLWQQAKGLGLQIQKNENFNDAFHLVFLNKVEPQLKKLGIVFLWDYPATMAALSKKKNDFWCERFEIYFDGIEVGNAYSELVDEKEQQLRFLEDQKIRKEQNLDCPEIDQELCDALKKINYDCGGIAIGMDRLVAALLDQKELGTSLAFPHFKKT